MSALGLYRLLTPYFLAGVTFPEEADSYLSVVGVTDVTGAYDGSASVVTGTVQFGDAPRVHTNATGGGFRWEDTEVRFRLTVPRDGAGFVDTAAHALPSQFAPLAAVLDRFRPVDQTATAPTEYPGVRFRLELLFEELHFELSDDWRPGLLDADHRIARDATKTDPVRIVLPRVAFAYEQTDDFQTPPAISLVSWGGGGFDAPSELRAGELVRMEPPIAAHRSGRVGFGLGAVIVDLDPDNTPPEILQFFGTDESFEGIYVQSARFYYADQGKDLGVNAAVKDLLISFAGAVSFDASVDLIGPQSTLSAELTVIDDGKDVPVSPGRQNPPDKVFKGGKVRMSSAATVRVQVTGGVPPVTVSVHDENGTERYDAAAKAVNIAALSPGEHTLSLSVRDSAPGADQQSYDEDVEVTLVPAPAAATKPGAPADRPAQPGDLPAITTSGGVSGAFAIRPGGNAGGTLERFLLDGPGAPTVTANGRAIAVTEGAVSIDVPENATGMQVVATWPEQAGASQVFTLGFRKSWPAADGFETLKANYLKDAIDDDCYEQSHAPGQAERGTAAVQAWLRQLGQLAGALPSVTVDAYASYEHPDLQPYDQRLSERRREVAIGAIAALAQVTGGSAHGHDEAAQAGRLDQQSDRKAVISATVTQPATTVTLLVSRGARTPPAQDVASQPVPPPSPLPDNKPPGVFRRVGIRVKVLRNEPVLLQLSGQLDFETDLEDRLRNPHDVPPLPAGGSLGLKQQPAAVAGANPNPKDGVTDFTLTIVHDPATNAWTETLTIGAHPDDVDGLLQLKNPHSGALTTENRLKDTLGSVLILAPVIGTAIGATNPNTAGSYAVLGGTIVGAAAVGAAGFLRSEKITLYGGELRFRQVIPPGDPAQFTDAGVLFDYGVEFGVDIESLGISTTSPAKVRYRAIGFNLNFTGGGYQPIFDTSKGYELNLSDLGQFKLPSPVDNVLKIFGARIAKVNPLTVELDLGMKIDLGVVTIDRFKVKLPVDPPGVPTILPSGIKLDISRVLVGSGFVNIVEPPAAPPNTDPRPGFGGIEGAFDVSLVPVKLRIAASFGIRPVSQGQRNATAVFLGLIIDLPAPIPLAQSGLGIYGFSGLFAMHYKRLESDPDPTDAVGPAILWLKAAGGEPAKLFNNGVTLWGPELDRWSFGVGISLGLTTGSFLVNLRGMFVLELPGPRVLIFTKVTIIGELKSMKPATDLTVGILGVIDLDFAQKRITVGIIVDFEIKEIVAVSLPVELFFDLQDLRNWHLYVGTFNAPASALVLGIVRGSTYIMISGPNIENWPGYGTTRTLTGVAFATGIGAAIVFGDEGIGLYLKVAARADVAVTFSPRVHLVGRLQLEGELRLFVVSVGAHGSLDLEATDPTYLKGEICGHVDFFFFSVQGCVHVEVGTQPPLPPPPGLVTNVWLQSHAPVISAGQGGDRPIDASLGDAAPAGSGTPPVVPIDTVPVVQFLIRPVVDAALTTFTKPLVPPSGLPPGGWVELSKDRKVSYKLTGLRLDGGITGTDKPPATWRPEPLPTPVTGTSRTDLALMSTVPLMGARALERSLDLEAIIDGVFGHTCDQVAPPAPVLWTFCGQLLGPSPHGWALTGIAWPDPAGTVRTTPVSLALQVTEREHANVDELLGVLLGKTSRGRAQPARVIGPNGPPDGDPGHEELRCVHLDDELTDGDPNPGDVGGVFRVTTYDASGVPSRAVRISGLGSQRGLDVGWRAVLELLNPVAKVVVTVTTTASPAVITAFETGGAVTMRMTTSGPKGVPDRVELTGSALGRLVVDAPSDETLLLDVCVLAGAGKPARSTMGGRLQCMRALQLPERRRIRTKGELPVTKELSAAARNLPDDRFVDLRTGPLREARLYLAVASKLFTNDSVLVEQLDAGGSVLGSDPLSALSPVMVTGIAGLPAGWVDPSGPWAAEVTPVATFLDDPALAGLVHVLVTVNAKADTVALRIRVQGAVLVDDSPAVVLAVAEGLTVAEVDRHDTEEGSRSGTATTLAGYLGATSAVPLLKPDIDYTLHVDYAATTSDVPAGGGAPVVATTTATQSFRFHTSAEPPARLDAYVLATSPRQEEEFVFADDVVRIVFNDLQVLNLYAAYGRTLTAVLRGADGIPIPQHEVKDIEEVPATYSSPLYDTLDAQVKAGKFGCLAPYHREGHASYTLPEPLRPSMAYTLDIEARPVPGPVGGRPIVPLFRRQFRTGRFRNLGELAAELTALPLDHVLLTGPLTGLTVGEQPDIAIETALTVAGLPAPAASARSRGVVLWRPIGGGYRPHAVMLDTSEPLWRWRDAPAEQQPLASDPSYIRIVPGTEPALQPVAAAPVTGFVHSPGGTRTLALLADTTWPATGATVTIEAVRPASALYQLPEVRTTVISVPLDGHAPWEDDRA